MGAKQTESSRITYLKLRAKTSESDPTPFFGKTEKKADSWEITEKFSSVDGHLRDISHSTYEYEGETKHKCSMKLLDPDGSVTVVESNFNNLLYGILNAMVSCTPDFINIDVWLGASKGATDKRYPSAGMTNNGDKLSWFYKFEELPKPTKSVVAIPNTKKTTTVTDDSNVIEFWCGIIDEIKGKLSDAPIKESSAKMKPNTKVENAYSGNDDDDLGVAPDPNSDLPFRFTPFKNNF